MSNKLTIALLLYNAAPFIGASLKSLLEVKGDFNILILDDASTDETNEVVSNFLDRLNAADRLKFDYHKNTINVGTVAQFFNAANLCKTEYIKPVDCADPFLSYDFSEIVHAFESSKADVIFTRPVFFENGVFSESAVISRITKNIISLPSKYRLCSLYSANHFVAPSAFFRTDFIQKIIPNIRTVRLLEDWPMWLYASFLGSKFRYLDKPFVAYRIHQAQKEKSTQVIEIFKNDDIQIEILKNRLIPFGNSLWGRRYYNFKSKLLNKILCRI